MKRTTDPSPPAGTDALSTALVADRRSGGFSLVPTRVFFTKGVGSHRDELRSFELALKDAGIEKLNLVHVSSIFPPKRRKYSSFASWKVKPMKKQLPLCKSPGIQ